jgi:DMSO reductase family type II enzyme heme b subunit
MTGHTNLHGPGKKKKSNKLKPNGVVEKMSGEYDMLNGKRILGAIWLIWLSGVLGFSAVLASEPPASGEIGSVSVRLYQLEGSLPSDDPTSSQWDSVPGSEFNLAPQVHWPPRIQEVTVKSVKVKGVHNGHELAILVDYEDPTEDVADAAALEFMVGDKMAHFAHGQEMMQVEGGPVNIWFWKNEQGQAVDMSAKGFATLQAQPTQDVQAKGIWQNGRWKIVFSRLLNTGDIQDVQIEPGEWRSVAFAIWNGAIVDGLVKEKGGQKAVSSWWYIRAEPSADNSIYGWVVLGIALAAGFELVIVRKLRKGQSV